MTSPMPGGFKESEVAGPNEQVILDSVKELVEQNLSKSISTLSALFFKTQVVRFNF
jgi:hypothetical protein